MKHILLLIMPERPDMKSVTWRILGMNIRKYFEHKYRISINGKEI